MTEFLPEGRRLAYKENTAALQSAKTLMQAAVSGAILEASCTVCDAEHNMHVDLGCMKGIIPRSEGAIGIESGATRDIALISRVGKPVCFKITKIDETGSEPLAILSRKAAQEEADKEYVSKLTPGDIIGARVTHLEQFGCFVDIGCGIASMIPIDAISVSRIVHPANRFSVGDDIFAVVKGRDQGHICLTHKELLGTWQENAARFRAGQTVTGIACGKTDYGVFIALTPNLCGLVRTGRYTGTRPAGDAAVHQGHSPGDAQAEADRPAPAGHSASAAAALYEDGRTAGCVAVRKPGERKDRDGVLTLG